MAAPLIATEGNMMVRLVVSAEVVKDTVNPPRPLEELFDLKASASQGDAEAWGVYGSLEMKLKETQPGPVTVRIWLPDGRITEKQFTAAGDSFELQIELR